MLVCALAEARGAVVVWAVVAGLPVASGVAASVVAVGFALAITDAVADTTGVVVTVVVSVATTGGVVVDGAVETVATECGGSAAVTVGGCALRR